MSCFTALRVRAARRPALALLACLFVFGGLGAKGQGPAQVAAPSHLAVNGLAAAFDLDVAPRFGWHVHVAEQSAFELRVSSTRENAEAAEGDVWASGKVSSAQQHDVRYAGPPLAASERYFWTVRIWGPRGASPWARVGSFGTGPGANWSNSAPIWAAPLHSDWADYTLRAQLTIDEVALGLRFRSPDSLNGYMWQFRGADNRLVPHRLVNGTFSVIENVALPAGTLALGKPAEVRIEAVQSTLRTFIDGVLVHTLEDATFPRGGVGVRTGNSESGRVAELSLEDTAGNTLFASDFAEADGSFACGSVRDSAWLVPRASNCLNAGASVDWAFLRKDFTLADQPIAWATAYATGGSPLPAKQYVYKLSLNGKPVGLGPTQSTAAETRYDGFDVTEALLPGATNTLGVLAYTTSGQKFQAELVVGYADGTREVIGSDATWQALPGDSSFPAAGSIGTSYYTAPRENLDARRFPSGFDAPGFAADGWDYAVEKSPLGPLAAAPMAKVAEQLHAPVEIVEKGAGHYFIDFGRSWVGGVKYEIGNGAAGDQVELRFGEVTSAPNTVRHQLQAGNVYQDTLTLRGGAQTLQTWGLRVFRYLEISGAPEPVTAENLQALALVYPFDAEAATFSASDPNLERVWQLSKNTIEAVNLNFYTDSWTRERTNYEADAYLQLLSTLYLTEDLSLGRYSLDYFATHRTWPTEWPLYVIRAVHAAWRQTGETEQLLREYTSLQSKLPEAWFESSTGLLRKDVGADGCNSVTDCDLVDWPPTQRDGFVFQPYNTVINVLGYRAYRDMAEIAEAIGAAEDAAAYAERADVLRAAINARLYVPELGRYDDGMDAGGQWTGHFSLHASAFALAFGVPEVAEAPRVAEYVASRGMACSVYCAAFLISGLYDAGQAQAALELLSGSGLSSWMNMLQLGAGATAEAWDPAQKSNLTYSHPWAASPAFLVPAGLFGIQPIAPGYASFRVRPQPGNLEHASLRVPTIRGTIAAAFAQGPEGFQLAVSVPGNTHAELSIPVPDGTTTLYLDQLPHSVQAEGGYARLTGISAGCHLLATQPSARSPLSEPLRGVCPTPLPLEPPVAGEPVPAPALPHCLTPLGHPG